MCLVPINTPKKSNSLFSFVSYVEKNWKHLLRIFDELKWEDYHLCTWLSGQSEKVGNEPLKMTSRAQRVHSAWSRSIRFTELQFDALFSTFLCKPKQTNKRNNVRFQKKNKNLTQGYELNKGNSWAAKKTQKTHAQRVHFWQEISQGLGYHVNMTFSRTMYIFRIFSLYHLGFNTQRRILLNKNQN